MTEPVDAPLEPARAAGRHAARPHKARAGMLAALALLLVAANLRSVISAAPPVLPEIQQELSLNASEAGFALTLTVFCFGLGALVCPMLLRALKPTTLLGLGMVVLAIGGAGRALLPGSAAFFVCTAAIGAGVAVGNVVVPVIIRLRFAHRMGLLTAAYAVTLSGGSVIATGLTWPFIDATGGNWRTGQLPWVGLVVLAIAVWAVATWSGIVSSRQAGPSGDGGLLRMMRSPLAWGVTAVMGLQSLVFYSVLSWGPSVMQSAGIDATTAGALVSLMSIVAIAANLAGPALIRGSRTVPGLIVIGICYLAGLSLLPWGVVPASFGVCILGLGVGASLPYALTKIASAFPVQLTGTMSSMAQGFGYILAGLGPWLFGVLHDLDPSWRTSLGFVALAGIAFTISGIIVHRATSHKTR